MATVTGRRRHSSDLVPGGLEILCQLRFRRREKRNCDVEEIEKAEEMFIAVVYPTQ